MNYVANPVRVKAWVVNAVAENKNEDGSVNIVLDAKNEKEENLEVVATKEMLARIEPKPGDYWVVQEDGYTYLNPKDVFERKYRLDEIINPEDKLVSIGKEFNDVIEELSPKKDDTPVKTRELALAATRYEEAEMWIRQHVIKHG